MTETIKQFNSFYTTILLQAEKAITTELLTARESRLLLELYRIKRCHPKDLIEPCNSDKGQVSRMLAKLSQHGLVMIIAANSDRRLQYVSLTNNGKQAAHALDKQLDAAMHKLIFLLSPDERETLRRNMQQIRELLQQ